MFENLNFSPGSVEYNNSDLDFSIPIKDQLDNLQEDLFQAVFYDQYVIDVGWYPSEKINGSFKLVVIKEYDWENPLVEKKCKSFDKLNQIMEELIAYVKRL